MKKYFLQLLVFFIFPVFAGQVTPALPSKNPPLSQKFFYIGLIGGYADIDWGAVVAQDPATYASNPAQAEGNGALFGGDIGYQFGPHFALEFEYIQLPDSYLTYNPVALITYGVRSTDVKMNFAALTLKLMAPISDTRFSLFADAGAAYQSLSDEIADTSTFAPTFGAGFNYRINEHFFADMSFQYATGYGESISLPMTDYIPEVYIYTFGINYIF